MIDIDLELQVLARNRQHIPTVSDEFKQRYRNDPIAWNRDCIMGGADPQVAGLSFYQEEILRELAMYHRVAVRGPHAIGKTALQARTVLWFATTRDGEDWKVPTTASSWQQLTRYLWPEIHKWASRLRWDVIGRRVGFQRGKELMTLNLRLPTGEAFAIASDKPEYIEGAHADQLLYLMDEAKAIRPATFESVEGAFASGNVYALACSTPGSPAGPFFDIHKRRPGYEDWRAIHITKEDAITARRMSASWAEARKRQWGEHSAVYQNRVEGNFASDEANVVVPLEWIELANDRWWEWCERIIETEIATDDRRDWRYWAGRAYDRLQWIRAVGVDVARQGDDKTVLAPYQPPAIVTLLPFEHQGTMQTTANVLGVLDRFEAQRGLAMDSPVAVVDVVGMGAGVFDRLEEIHLERVAQNWRLAETPAFHVAGFSAGSSAPKWARDRGDQLGFTDQRSLWWWRLREALDPAFAPVLALPPDDYLTGDLTSPRYRMLSGTPARYRVESKDEIKKRLGRSTDYADAVVQALSEPVEREIEEVDSGLADELQNYRGI